MRALTRITSMLCLCLFMTATALTAQDGKVNNRKGLWGGLGLGYGVAGLLDCPGSDCETEGGFSGNARIGFTSSPSLRFALGTNGWVKSENSTTVTIGLISAQALYYPGGKDFFLLGGAGLATWGCDGCDTETGFGGVLGIGYDIPLNRSGSLALTPFLNWYTSTIEYNPYVLQFGLGLTFN